MAFDFKKEYKQYYTSKSTPQIIEIPPMNYIAVRGSGDPNEENGDYKKAVEALYGIAYTLKMSYKGNYSIDGFFDYVVPPLEGFWWQDGIKGVDYTRKNTFQWVSLIRLPDFITPENVEWAIQEASKKMKQDYTNVEFLSIEEGLCVQIMHVGAYDEEPATVAKMDQFLQDKGYQNDFSSKRMHHEIYLSDPRKTAKEKCKTLIRHPIKKVEMIH